MDINLNRKCRLHWGASNICSYVLFHRMNRWPYRDSCDFHPHTGLNENTKPVTKTTKPRLLNDKSDLFCFGPQCFLWPPVTIYMLLYSTLLCMKIARAPGGHKKLMLTKLGGGGRNRIDPINLVGNLSRSVKSGPPPSNYTSHYGHIMGGGGIRYMTAKLGEGGYPQKFYPFDWWKAKNWTWLLTLYGQPYLK